MINKNKIRNFIKNIKNFNKTLNFSQKLLKNKYQA